MNTFVLPDIIQETLNILYLKTGRNSTSPKKRGRGVFLVGKGAYTSACFWMASGKENLAFRTDTLIKQTFVQNYTYIYKSFIGIKKGAIECKIITFSAQLLIAINLSKGFSIITKLFIT